MRSHPWQRWLGMTAFAWGLTVGPACAEEPVIPRFEVRQYLLEGNTILPADQIATILQRYTGK